MAGTEQELRREAVRRRLAGESPEEIARSLGRTRQWVAKWVRRHEAGGEEWAAGEKRGPVRAPHRTSPELEAQVLSVRGRLVANPWAQVGADAVAWELEKLGVEPPPRRTIERILARGGATGVRNGGGRRAPKGVPYPTVAVEQPDEFHEADLVGPRHLRGGVHFHALNAIDLASHRCGIEIVPDKSDRQVAAALPQARRAGEAPIRQRRTLRRSQRSRPDRAALPPPWRDPEVRAAERTVAERNRRTLQRHLRQAVLPAGTLRLAPAAEEALARLRELPQRQPPLPGHQRAHPGRDRPARQAAQAAAPRRAPLGLAGRRHDRVFVRFVRSDRKFRLLGRSITMPKTVVYEYLTAVLDLAIPPTDGNLRVLRAGEIITTATITIGGR